jgi:hypothetical protein
VEAQHQLAVLVLAERVLELVPVAPLGLRRDDRLDRRVLEAADAGQGVAHLLLLLGQLALVGQHLPGRAGVRGTRLDALGARLEHLHGACLGVAALGLVHAGADAVAGHGPLHEDDVAIEPGDAGAAVGERLDAQVELVAVARADGLGRGGFGHRPYCGSPLSPAWSRWC